MWMVAKGGTGHTRAFGAASPEPIEFGCEPGDVFGEDDSRQLRSRARRGSGGLFKGQHLVRLK